MLYLGQINDKIVTKQGRFEDMNQVKKPRRTLTGIIRSRMADYQKRRREGFTQEAFAEELTNEGYPISCATFRRLYTRVKQQLALEIAQESVLKNDAVLNKLKNIPSKLDITSDYHGIENINSTQFSSEIKNEKNILKNNIESIVKSETTIDNKLRESTGFDFKGTKTFKDEDLI